MPKLPARPPSVPDDIDLALIESAEALLSEHFFDPDVEDTYKQLLSAERSRMAHGLLLEDGDFITRGSKCTVQLEALRTWTMFRISLDHKDFAATVEGSWSFELQELQKPRVTHRRGSRGTWEEALDDIEEYCAGNLLGADDEDDDDSDPEDADAAQCDLDPKEPPPATATDRARIKAMAKRLVRDFDHPLSPEDQQWLQDTPRSLPLITEALIATATEKGVADPLVAAHGMLLTTQLEYVRYRQDRGWEWAKAMLDEFQQRLLLFAQEGGAPTLFMAMGQALADARITVSNDMQQALADAGFQDADPPAAQDLQLAAQEMLTELASQLDTPFEVIETFKNMDAVMPAEVRGTLATILANAEQEPLREAAAILLLDRSAAVRSDIVAALASPTALKGISSTTLRRMIAIRGWLPDTEREKVDELIRKVRLSGVEIGAWPKPLPDTEYYASMIDGSGAQSLLMISRGTSKGIFRAVLLRHGEGIADAWQEEGLSRGKLNKMLRGTHEELVVVKVSRDYVDTTLQHAIGCSVAQGSVPPELFLQVAEGLNGGDWKARQLDIAAEAHRLWDALPAADRTGAALQRNLEEAKSNLNATETLATWYEDGPSIQAALKGLPEDEPEALIQAILDHVVEANRLKWAERFVLMAMWSQAASEAKHRRLARGLIATAVALVDEQPLNSIPAMMGLAARTLNADMFAQ